MLALRLLPILLALVVLGAHFYRATAFVGMAALAALIALVFVPRPWAARVLQIGLVLGALEWIRTAAVLVAERSAMGAPWLRLALILGAVAAVTALCLLAFRSPSVRAHFRLAHDQ